MSLEKTRVLIVDDETFMTNVLEETLRSKGFEVLTASDGCEALEKFRANPDIRLIVADIIMPFMDGLELIKALKAEPGSNVPIIVLTSSQEISVALDAIASGASDYLLKDKNIQTSLAISVEKVLEQERLKKERDRLMADLARKNTQLEKSNKELKELNQLKNKFLGIAAHDLRNPLSTITGYSDILLDGSLPEPDKETRSRYVEKIRKIAYEMLYLVEELLDISIIESGKLELRPQQCDMNQLLAERVEIKNILAAKKNVSIEAHFFENLEISADLLRLSQAVDNLIDNAIKFSPSGEKIVVTLARRDDLVEIGVKDNGPGVPRELQQQIFGEYKTLAEPALRGEKSTGLGLAIAKKIIEAHGGTITVSSRVGKGSLFTCRIPVRA